MINVKRLFAISVLCMFLMGCVTFGAKAQCNDPGIIVIRNSSRTDLARVSLESESSVENNAHMVGSISPVKAGVSQIYFRPKKRHILPDYLSVTWEDSKGRRFKQKVFIRGALDKCSGSAKEELVFTIDSNNMVVTSIEKR